MTITLLIVGAEGDYYVATRNKKIDRNVGIYHEKAN